MTISQTNSRLDQTITSLASNRRHATALRSTYVYGVLQGQIFESAFIQSGLDQAFTLARFFLYRIIA